MTISDVFAVPNGGGSRPGSPDVAEDRARTDTYTRARVAGTVRDGKGMLGQVRADVVGAWVWRDVPPALTEVIAARNADVSKVPGGNPLLRHGWTVYNHTVAIPVTAVGYLLTWIVQHPARLLLTAAITTPLILFILAA